MLVTHLSLGRQILCAGAQRHPSLFATPLQNKTRLVQTPLKHLKRGGRTLLSVHEIIVTVPRSMILKCSDCGNQLLIVAPSSEHSPGIPLLRSEVLLQHETILQRVQTNGALGISEPIVESFDACVIIMVGEHTYVLTTLSTHAYFYVIGAI